MRVIEQAKPAPPGQTLNTARPKDRMRRYDAMMQASSPQPPRKHVNLPYPATRCVVIWLIVCTQLITSRLSLIAHTRPRSKSRQARNVILCFHKSQWSRDRSPRLWYVVDLSEPSFERCTREYSTLMIIALTDIKHSARSVFVAPG